MSHCGRLHLEVGMFEHLQLHSHKQQTLCILLDAVKPERLCLDKNLVEAPIL
jgi:hypothetical protein